MKMKLKSDKSSKFLSIAEETVNELQNIIGTDAGGRGMKNLIVPDDLLASSQIFAALDKGALVLVLSGFPCCVKNDPPTETDGPPGAVALAFAAVQLGYRAKIVTDESSEIVFRAAISDDDILESFQIEEKLSLEVFSSTTDEEERLQSLAKSCHLILSCERAGPAEDGNCYTMRGINMTEIGLISPIHKLIEYSDCKFLAIGDGGNELGMGKVLGKIKQHIPKGSQIGCAIPADHLVAASVSNWGGYALAAGAAVMRAAIEESSESEFIANMKNWLNKCLPSEESEISLLNRCVAMGCRDGVSGKIEATVDGMPLERSLQCIRDLRATILKN